MLRFTLALGLGIEKRPFPTWTSFSFSEFWCKWNSFSYEMLCTRPRFEKEAQENSEMTYSPSNLKNRRIARYAGTFYPKIVSCGFQCYQVNSEYCWKKHIREISFWYQRPPTTPKCICFLPVFPPFPGFPICILPVLVVFAGAQALGKFTGYLKYHILLS